MKKLLLFIYCMVFLWGMTNGIVADASVSEPVSLHRKQTITESLALKKTLVQPANFVFHSADLNDTGTIALGAYDTGQMEERLIAVLHADGTFAYAYRFNSSGHFKVKWQGENLLIRLSRSDVVLKLSPAGEIEEVYEVHHSTQERAFWRQSSQLSAGEYRVLLKEGDLGFLNIFISDYAQVFMANENGEEQLIYDASAPQRLRAIFVFCIMVFALCMVLIFAIVPIIKCYKRKTRDGNI